MDELVAEAVKHLTAGVDELSMRCDDKDSLEQSVEKDIQNALRTLLSPLDANVDNFPYLLHGNGSANVEDQQSDNEDDSAETEMSHGEAMSISEVSLPEVSEDAAAEYVFVAGKTHVYAAEYLGEEWSSETVRKAVDLMLCRSTSANHFVE